LVKGDVDMRLKANKLFGSPAYEDSNAHGFSTNHHRIPKITG